MASLEELQALEREWLMPTYRRMPVAFERGEGAHLWDGEGKRYLDFLTGISVSSLGHCNPAVVAAIREQAGRLMHVSNLAYSEPAIRLAERLARSSLGGKAFFCNSGAEANECAIKLARKHAHRRGIDEPEIVSLEGAFHGRTLGTLAATPHLARVEDFGPPLAGFRAVARDGAEALRQAVGPRTAAVIVEPIQGESGVWPIADEVLLAARQACDETGALLIFDEIQTGLGRTGSLWAYEQTPVRPDVLTSAKALGGGLPIGACVAAPAAADVFEPGDHGSTFAGAPLAAAAALAVLDLVDDGALLRRVRELGGQLMAGLEALDGVAAVRGRGLMVAAQLADGLDAGEVQGAALEAGLIVNVPASGTLRLLPPLVVSSEQIDDALEIVAAAL
ncbi:MAG: acetylornithine/N-succinyldiaminopimelate aminotransferase [Solirubrobacterales bacterium]|jgi:predicted acetylornithine/succinylornithine family transaminase|nr:acetylornithine/N-succinyldiaminopimelate aminotransferase [Solirubrobacterales bacterium]